MSAAALPVAPVLAAAPVAAVTPDGRAATGPVFVVGMNGSGTTMLADSLGKHPALFMFPFESKVMPYFAAREREFGDLAQPAARRRLADEIGCSKPFWHANGKRNLVVDDAVIDGAGSVASVFDALYGHLASRQGKRRWGEKSPVNTEHITRLAAMYPEARFIHIIRDGRDAAQSFHRRWLFDPRHTIWRWKKTVALGRAQGAALPPGRYLELHYEALTADPETHMQRLCEFVGLPFDEAVLGSSMRHMAGDAKAQGGGRIIANSERWRQYFSTGEVAALEGIAGAMLRQLGYAAATPGDAELGGLQLRYLRAKDNVLRTFAHFRDFGWKGVPVFGRMLGSALKTKSTRQF
jgi:hypothetical protein